MRRVRLTGAGRGLLGVGIVLYVCGVLLGWPELLVPGAAAVIAVALAALLVMRRPPVQLDRAIRPDRVTVGGTAQALVTVENRSRRPSPPFVASDRIGGDRRVDVPVEPVDARASVRIPYEVPTSRRGRIQLGPLTVTRRDPLGLFRHDQVQASHRTLWVHPRTHALRPFPTGITLDLEGPLVETAPRGAVTFSTLREYVPGDDVRQIHWRSSARTGTLMVREHVDTSQPRTTIALDIRAAVWTAEAFEHGVEAAASIAVAAERDGHPVVLIVGDSPDGDRRTGDGRGQGQGQDHPTHVLDRLALVETDPARGQRLVDLLYQTEAGGVLVVVTGGQGAEAAGQWAGLRRRFSLVVVVRVTEGAVPRIERRAGLVMVEAPTGRQFARLWNRLVGG